MGEHKKHQIDIQGMAKFTGQSEESLRRALNIQSEEQILKEQHHEQMIIKLKNAVTFGQTMKVFREARRESRNFEGEKLTMRALRKAASLAMIAEEINEIYESYYQLSVSGYGNLIRKAEIIELFMKIIENAQTFEDFVSIYDNHHKKQLTTIINSPLSEVFTSSVQIPAPERKKLTEQVLKFVHTYDQKKWAIEKGLFDFQLLRGFIEETAQKVREVETPEQLDSVVESLNENPDRSLEKILLQKAKDIFSSFSQYNIFYESLSKRLRPDVCSDDWKSFFMDALKLAKEDAHYQWLYKNAPYDSRFCQPWMVNSRESKVKDVVLKEWTVFFHEETNKIETSQEAKKLQESQVFHLIKSSERSELYKRWEEISLDEIQRARSPSELKLIENFLPLGHSVKKTYIEKMATFFQK